MKIKFIAALSIAILDSFILFAQDEGEKKGGFKKENIFIGSAINLGISGDAFQIGANPEIGYSIAQWLDAGIAVNLNYSSFRYAYFSDQVFNYGVGSFIRIWPAKFLFLSAIPEYNWIDVKRKYINNAPSLKENYKAGSLLLGAGYGNRIVGRTYSYFALMFDALSNENSPYRDAQNRALPIIRAGFAVYLNSNKGR